MLGAHTGAAAISLAQGLGHPGIRDRQRSPECRKGVTHCKHGGSGAGDKFCPPIQVKMKMRGLGRGGEAISGAGPQAVGKEGRRTFVFEQEALVNVSPILSLPGRCKCGLTFIAGSGGDARSASPPPRAAARRRIEQVSVSLLTLLNEPDSTRLATGDPKSGSALQPERGGRRGDAGSHPFPSP